MTRPLSLAHLTFLDLPPPALVRVAAAAGFAAVGLRLIAVTPTTPGYALMDDPKMMRETRAALRDTGVTVNDIEFLRFTPDFQADQFDAFLSVGAELGAKYIVTAPYDPDLGRLSDNLARFADRAAGFGLAPVLEFFPWTNVADLQAALEIVTNTGTASAGVLLDTLHFDRSGSQLGDISRADPSRLPFIHLCDALVKPSYSEEELLHTAREARLIPGHGQIGLTDILERLPRDTGIGVEIPASAVPESGSETARAREIFLGTHKLLGRTALA
ncbi:sugar phosphate isomerase/epimerase family protein [Primorskyibacter sp. 2E233]|uniref:sugar phosphate isomerase/epimerase family protein n=1 Tax=Primorskyibacter sp. 2E233 TaxID=3413431 RepID=UPI003BF0619A